MLERFRGLFQRDSVGYLPLSMISGYGVDYYPNTTYGVTKVEELGSSFGNLVNAAYAANPIIFACMQARVQLFSEARFQWQQLRAGQPGDLFSTAELSILEQPWPGGTTSQLLKEALIDADLAGNAFIYRERGTLQRLRPDWVTIIAGNVNTNASVWDIGTQVLGYGYQPGGPESGRERVILDASQVAHFKSTHDPSRRFSGMSWLVPLIREITSDQAATVHKQKFFENAATPNLAVKFDPTMNLQKAQEWIDLFKKDHEGARNAYKTLFLGGGADTAVVGANLRQADFLQVQSGIEIRIASAAGVPPIVIGIKGGLDSATYSNYGQARRAFADLTMRPLWRDIAGALSTLLSTPGGSRLWYDDRDISFLQEDVKDAADIHATNASAMRQLIDAGFDAKTVVDAVTAGDLNRLTHTGLFSVQLQPPGLVAAPQDAPALPDAATPARAAIEASEVRCACGRLLAEIAAAPYRFTCSRCKAVTEAGILLAA